MNQVKKLVSKVVSKENICYRRLTDKPKEEKKEGESAAATDDDTDVSMSEESAKTLDVETLAKG